MSPVEAVAVVTAGLILVVVILPMVVFSCVRMGRLGYLEANRQFLVRYVLTQPQTKEDDHGDRQESS